MNLHKLTAALTAGILTACMSSAYLQAKAEEQGEKLRIMPLGDSITDGFNVVGGYRVTLWKMLEENGYTDGIDFVGPNWGGDGIDPNHAGYSGYSIADIEGQRSGIYNFIDWLMESNPADVVLLQIGTNDILSSYELDTAGERLELLVDAVLTDIPDDGCLYLATIPYMDADVTYYTDAYTAEEMDAAVDDYNAKVKALAEKKISEGKHVILSDNNAVLTKADLADGVHPSEEGYAKLGMHWYEMLKPYLDGEITFSDTPVTTTEPETSPEMTESETSIETTELQETFDRGDVNQDASVNLTDLILLQKYLLGLNPPERIFITADMNQDGETDAFDLALLKRAIFGQVYQLHED